MRGAHFHRRHLPHIYLDEAIYFITFRLKGSIPIHKLIELKSITNSKLNSRSKENRYELDRLFFQSMMISWIDIHMGNHT